MHSHALLRVGIAFALSGFAFGQDKPASKVNALNELSDSLEQIARQVSPGVVQVLVSGFRTASPRNSSGRGVVAREEGTGSGVIVDPSGYIITNNHVVEGSTKVRGSRVR